MLPDTPSHLLTLTSQALDEFETAPIAASVRRALRIARLRGDEREALRFILELGLEPTETDDTDKPYDNEAVRQEFVRARTLSASAKSLGMPDADGTDIIATMPLDEMRVREVPFDVQLSTRTRMERHARQVAIDGVLSTVRSIAFEYLSRCETELRLTLTGEHILSRHRAAVDAALAARAPAVLDKLTSAFRRAVEVDDAEARTHALTSCRRVLVAIADIVFPARSEPHIDAKGTERPVGAGQYRNRIIAAVEASGDSTYARALRTALDEFAMRLDRLDDLTQKGVHDEVTEAEMEFGVMQAYVLAGEVLRATGRLDV